MAAEWTVRCLVPIVLLLLGACSYVEYTGVAGHNASILVTNTTPHTIDYEVIAWRSSRRLISIRKRGTIDTGVIGPDSSGHHTMRVVDNCVRLRIQGQDYNCVVSRDQALIITEALLEPQADS